MNRLLVPWATLAHKMCSLPIARAFQLRVIKRQRIRVILHVKLAILHAAVKSKILWQKKYGKTVSQMSNIEKAMMEADKVRAAGKTAVDKGRSCRIAAGTNSAKLAACANEEMNAFFSAKGENYDSLDSMEKVKLETEFMIAKGRAELASPKNMQLCMEAIPASDSLSTKKTKSSENEAKAEYEVTGITIDAASINGKDAAAKDRT